MGHLALHVVTKNLVQIAHQLGLAGGSKKLQGATVDLQDLVAGDALVHPGGVLRQVFPQIGHALGAPGIEQLLEGAEILQPERCGRQIEHVFVIVA